jgi:4-diphosphocytidyl-2-C-methyl-D-erythritol kinase
MTSVWPAPAKLNLMLRIVGRRADGYHQLQTVFQFIDLVDSLTFDLRSDGVVERGMQVKGLPQEADLVVRAACLLKARTGVADGVTIRYQKQIPSGGGLGGGSSDAATTLVALNHLWGCDLPESVLAELGLELGADVPVFVHGRAAWGEGVGETLSDIELPEPYYLVLAPAAHVDTRSVFQDPDLTRNSRRITIRDFLAGEVVNDCLPVVRKNYPEVAQAFDWLNEKLEARLTGTGACVFAECRDRALAESLLQHKPDNVAGWMVRGRNRSPLLEKIDSLV